MKQLDMNKTVAELAAEYPEVKEIMVELGFKDITSPVALKFMGKVMTIPKGAAIKGIPMKRIVAAFEGKGFAVTRVPGHEAAEVLPGTAEDRNTKLKNLMSHYLKEYGDAYNIVDTNNLQRRPWTILLDVLLDAGKRAVLSLEEYPQKVRKKALNLSI